jgi:hypothetical protein
VYRDDLARLPENGWSLFGLAQSLHRQGKEEEAVATDACFHKIWSKADVQIKSSCLCQEGVSAAFEIFRKSSVAFVHCHFCKERGWHTRYFIQMTARYGKKLESAPECLPSGWAAVLHLFELR